VTSSQTSRKDIIPVDVAGTLHGLFRERVRRSPQQEAYRYIERDGGAWRALTWTQMAAKVEGIASLLVEDGDVPGDRIALWLPNSPTWIAWEQAALARGMVVVPLYNEDRPENIVFILNDAGVRILVIRDEGRWKRLIPLLDQLPQLERVFILQRPQAVTADSRLRYAEPADMPGPDPVSADPASLASIIYTSGTTGRSKGVMLSHRNMLWVAHQALQLLDVYPDDLFLSILPLSHTLERTGGYYLPMMAGASVAYGRSVAGLAEDLSQVRPTVVISVPRVFERIYTRLQAQRDKMKRFESALFDAAVAVGWRRFLYSQGRGRWHLSLLAWPLLRRLVARRVLERLGGRVRIAVSGGAAMPFAVARLFLGLGLCIVQGYGLTETSPVVSVNTVEDNDPASVGLPLPGIELRLGAEDEILVRGPGVMLGYWNNAQAAAQAIDPDGWLHTGDQARIERGHLYITGRLKDIMVLSNGEKISPVDMEAAIALDPLFEQVMVIGEGQPFLSALVVLNRDMWYSLAPELGLDPAQPQSLSGERAQKYSLARITQKLRDFPAYAKVRRVILSLDPWSIENGLLTPTLKIRRQPILAQFARQIAEVYARGPASAVA
jgi:long-chain acyl-CoA synthetase